MVLPEPYRTFVAEVANGSSLGSADDGARPTPGEPAWGFKEWVQRWHTGDDWWD
ncbi:hypothetical protein ACFUJY_22175 [Streptomyces sp. NPDC057249]|uniref:hypothetical protein n=1 Tax=Streptomyces sp. NPDC057249 TaxID=3346067 RepID=UPI003638677A